MKKIIEDLLKVALKFSRAGMVTAAELAAIKRAQAAIRPVEETFYWVGGKITDQAPQ